MFNTQRLRNGARAVHLARPPSVTLSLLFVLSALLMFLAAPARAIPVDQWTTKLVNNQHSQTMSLCFGDVDSDGRVDIVSDQYWFRNPGGDMLGTWTRVALPVGMGGFAVTDVDGDAFADIIAQKTVGDLNLYWLEATNAGATAWSQVLIGAVPVASHPEGAQGYRVGQVELGGKPEVAISSGGGIYYFRIPADPAAGAWPRVRINAAPSDEGFAFGDVDRDGQLDVAATTGNAKGVVWYRNPGNGGADWAGTQVATFSEADYPDRTELGDFNGDGRLDIVVSEENGMPNSASTIWWEQPLNAFAGSWTAHPVVTQGSTNSMDVADMDQDGDTDLILAEHYGNLRMQVWSNNGAGVMSLNVLSTGIESHLGARTVDLDGDGDLDIVSIAWNTPQNIHLWRNDNGGGASPVPGPGAVPGAPLIASLEAWPNPFNPSVEFAVGMSGAASLRVDIHDVAGRRVRQLFEGPAAAGVFSLRWDGTDDQGARLPGGLYLVRAASGAEQLVGKVLLVK
ncbi:MAG: VCBS repeat-containing protein [bacterium]|nr:VCBS repeat-containing protein [bacterium]